MALSDKKTLIARRLAGKERTEEHARSMKIDGRASLVWELIKRRFWRIVLVNLIMLAFCLPLIAVVVVRWTRVYAQGLSAVFSAGLGLSPCPLPSIAGAAEYGVLLLDLSFFALLIPALALAAIGIAGGVHHMRVLIRTEGIFLLGDFWQGVKRNFLQTLEAMLFFGIVLYVVRILADVAQYHVALGDPASGWLITSEVLGYLILSVALLVAMWMVSIGDAYKQGPISLFVSAVAVTFRTLPFTVLFAAIASIPVLLSLFGGAFFGMMGSFLLFLFGICYALLVWMAYSQWVFDRYLGADAETVAAAAERREGASEEPARPRKPEEPVIDYKTHVLLSGKSTLLSRALLPIDEGNDPVPLTALDRATLKGAEERRAAILSECAGHAAAHAKDPAIAEYNQIFEEREKSLPSKKKKRTKKPKMLGK